MKWKCLLTMISIVMLISCKSAAQQPTVPDIILKRFAILYPTHKNLTWELENGNYEAEFIKGEKEMTVVFEPDGAVAQTETVSDTSAIPQSIKDYVKTNMAGHDITEEIGRAHV